MAEQEIVAFTYTDAPEPTCLIFRSEVAATEFANRTIKRPGVRRVKVWRVVDRTSTDNTALILDLSNPA